ncbi:MAG TPA: tetratricopeptide repeat protein [bacterium]|nr:tetratricopeptide repeat protein [bacterium]
MKGPIQNRAQRHGLSRREFLWLTSATSAGMLAGCAVNPVTGQRQLMLMSEGQEIEADRQYAPHQFSSDLGVAQDAGLNRYLSDVGEKLTTVSHRTEMPYSFRAVNAVYVNAYAFPGGSIATTRGILLAIENEAELAALLGHEIGHVTARHTAERMSKAMLLNVAVGLGSMLVSQKSETAGLVTAGVGMIGSTLLLAKYSRDDERQADALGMEYMVKAGYTPEGMVGLMNVLRSLSSHSPGAIEMMFASHPMSEERYQTAVNRVNTVYGDNKSLPEGRERYMDHTAGLRRIRTAIEAMQKGQEAMARKKYADAESLFTQALTEAPDDYAGLVMMAHLQIAMDKPKAGEGFAEKARQVYPDEAQAHHIGGIAKLVQKKYAAAFERFDAYERILPGDPNPIFLKGYSQEGMQHRPEAAREYTRYLQNVDQGQQADHARQRLTEWGYIQQETPATTR